MDELCLLRIFCNTVIRFEAGIDSDLGYRRATVELADEIRSELDRLEKLGTEQADEVPINHVVVPKSWGGVDGTFVVRPANAGSYRRRTAGFPLTEDMDELAMRSARHYREIQDETPEEVRSSTEPVFCDCPGECSEETGILHGITPDGRVKIDLHQRPEGSSPAVRLLFDEEKFLGQRPSAPEPCIHDWNTVEAPWPKEIIDLEAFDPFGPIEPVAARCRKCGVFAFGERAELFPEPPSAASQIVQPMSDVEEERLADQIEHEPTASKVAAVVDEWFDGHASEPTPQISEPDPPVMDETPQASKPSDRLKQRVKESRADNAAQFKRLYFERGNVTVDQLAEKMKVSPWWIKNRLKGKAKVTDQDLAMLQAVVTPPEPVTPEQPAGSRQPEIYKATATDVYNLLMQKAMGKSVVSYAMNNGIPQPPIWFWRQCSEITEFVRDRYGLPRSVWAQAEAKLKEFVDARTEGNFAVFHEEPANG